MPNVTEDHPLLPITLYNKYKGMCEPLLLKNTDENYIKVPITQAEEQEFLIKMNEYIKTQQQELQAESNIASLTFQEFIDKLYNVLYDIINDISRIDYTTLDYDDNKWWILYVNLLQKIINILFSPLRAFYTGFIIILISLCLYFIDLTS